MKMCVRVLCMRVDYDRDFDPADNDQAGALTEGLTGTLESILSNPVLPSGFDLPARAGASKLKWEFTKRDPAPFERAWKGMREHSSHFNSAL